MFQTSLNVPNIMFGNINPKIQITKNLGNINQNNRTNIKIRNAYLKKYDEP